MNKAIIAIVAILACFLPLAAVIPDNTTGADLIGTIIYGTVYDNETGEPIASSVIIYGSDFGVVFVGGTSEDGTYSIDVGKGGDYSIFVQKDGYVSEWANVSVRLNEKIQVDFWLDPIPPLECSIFGIVSDSETGEPLADVYINVWLIDDEGYWYGICDFWTNDDGKYSIDVDEGTYVLTFEKEGYETQGSKSIEVHDDYQLDIALDLFQQGVYGIITDENGDPLEGVSVSLSNDYGRDNDETDAEGKYMIRTRAPGNFTIDVYANGHRPYSQEVTIDEDVLEEVNIQLEKAYLPDPIVRLIYRILELLGIV